jgi:hypothetical protein
MEQSMYGLNLNDVKCLAFEIEDFYKIKHPFNETNKKAGRDWINRFFRRYPDLSIRSPQGTNLSRAVAFIRPKVQQFFTLYKEVLQQGQFLEIQIWNMDEIGLTNVHKPGKKVASRC